ncbi:MAG: T9SS type A sorting domain-containing protein, partial [Draconibacterium sp.]|nr:T9SS type A sorting domain-containing protein [Draconibacterium sp.]
AGGMHVFTYNADSTESACVRTLNVEVIEVERVAPEVESLSPTDTIADNHPVFVITFVGDVTFGESGSLTVTPKGESVASLEIPITEDMIVGNVVTIPYVYDPEVGGLELDMDYVVTIASGIFISEDDVAWDGISDDTTWEFTTGSDNATYIDPKFDVTEFSVYPNPFSDMINIVNHDKLTRVVISNIAGQRVIDVKYPNSEIRTNGLVSGVYLISFITEEGIAKTERIIKN